MLGILTRGQIKLAEPITEEKIDEENVYGDFSLVEITWLDASKEVTFGKCDGVISGTQWWTCPMASQTGPAFDVRIIRRIYS